MRVLWITNILLPDACRKLNMRVINEGGWMHSLLEEYTSRQDVNIAVASIYKGKELIHFGKFIFLNSMIIMD